MRLLACMRSLIAHPKKRAFKFSQLICMQNKKNRRENYDVEEVATIVNDDT